MDRLAVRTDQLAAADADLLDEARANHEASWADRTRQSYREQWTGFVGWCEQHGHEPLPAEPGTVVRYLAARSRQGRKVSTIALGLAAIGHAHREAGYDAPSTHPVVAKQMKGIRHRYGVRPTQKAPLVAESLRTLALSLPDTLIGARDRALLLVGFAGALRRSELVALTVADLSFTPEGLVVLIQRSKGDQEGAGVELAVPFGRAAATCPVRALRAWLEVAGIAEGPVFRAVHRNGQVRGQLRACDVAEVVKRRVAPLGLNPASFAGHSLRAGLATSAARAGKPVHVIQATTRHRSANMVATYVRRAKLFDDVASEGLL